MCTPPRSSAGLPRETCVTPLLCRPARPPPLVLCPCGFLAQHPHSHPQVGVKGVCHAARTLCRRRRRRGRSARMRRRSKCRQSPAAHVRKSPPLTLLLDAPRLCTSPSQVGARGVWKIPVWGLPAQTLWVTITQTALNTCSTLHHHCHHHPRRQHLRHRLRPPHPVKR
jgi:hypothetical protein